MLFILNDGQPDLRLHPIHEFSKWYGTSMKRKSLISKWNNTSKTAILRLKIDCVIFLMQPEVFIKPRKFN